VTGFRLDPSVLLLPEDRALLGGTPLVLLRLGAAGWRVVEAIRDGAPLPAGHGPLTNRLLDAGAIHPVVITRPPRPGEITVVIPAYRAQRERLCDLVATLAPLPVVIVDDGSDPPLHAVPGAELIRRDTNGGPGAARTTGVASVGTPLVAFLDADTEPEPAWLDALVPHFDDPVVGAVAPRVRSSPGTGARARYETARSPLDLGAGPAVVRPGSRVPYLPAAAIVVRVEALRAVGGFDEELRVGEDVDLVWRLHAAGWRVRYEPAATVQHVPRPTWAAWLRQRHLYGTSAAPLASRHGPAVAPVRLDRWSIVVWVLAIVHPLAGAAVAAGTTAALARKLRALRSPWPVSVRLAGLGNLYAGRVLASALVRAWAPGTLLAAIVSRRARRVVIAALILPPLLTWRRGRSPLDPARAVALSIADDAAYGTGVWRGVWRARSLAAVRPDLTHM
jgi:mycofactocin glycosyltransferase